jgi:hypothetical protein
MKPEGNKSFWRCKYRLGRVLLKWILSKYFVKVWFGLKWLQIEFSGRILRTFGFHIRQGVS